MAAVVDGVPGAWGWPFAKRRREIQSPLVLAARCGPPISALALAMTASLAPRSALSQTAPAPGPAQNATAPPGLWSSTPTPVYRALGGVALGSDFGASVWLATGALSSQDLQSAMLKPLPVGLALGAAAAGATAGALLVTDDRRFMRLSIPIAGGVFVGAMVAGIGGGGWYLSCDDSGRDACEHRAARFFAGSLSLGTFLGGATGLALALSAPPRSADRRASASVFAGPGSLLVKF